MPVTRLHRLLCGLLLCGLIACGDDSAAPGGGTGTGTGDGDGDGNGMDASTDTPVDTGDGDGDVDPGDGDGDPGDGDGDVDPGDGDGDMMDEDAGLEGCPNDCRGLADECNTVACNPDTLECELTPVGDGTACGSQDTNACSLPDRCMAGVCEGRHLASGTACGDQGRTCHIDDACDGNGSCVDNGREAPGTACDAGMGSPTASTACDAPDSCNGDGQCDANFTAPDTGCGDEQLCVFAPLCDGSGTCLAPVNKPDTTSCGPENEPVGTSTFCHPRDMLCDGAGGCDTAVGDSPTTRDGADCDAGSGDPDLDDTCDNPDTCVDFVCSPNFEPSSTTCDAMDGNPTLDDTCNNPDTCNGFGGCSANHEPAITTCGLETICSFAPLCDGSGACDGPVHKADTTICGLPASECHLAPLCDGSGTCEASEPADPGVLCGDDTDIECDDPDECDGAGVCDANYPGGETACGSTVNNDCDQPDSCNGAGGCGDNYEPDTTTCGAEADECMLQALCVGDGNCSGAPRIDVGCEMTVTGTVVDFASRTGIQGLTVELVGSNPLVSDTTGVDGSFSLTLPVGLEIFLRVQPSTGRWGSINGYIIDPGSPDAGEIGIPDDATALAALAVGGVDPVDTADAMLLVVFGGAHVGGEQASVNDVTCTPSGCGPVTEGPSGMVASNTLMDGDFIAFTNLATGGTTGLTISGAAGVSVCTQDFPIPQWPLEAHTITQVSAVCTAP